MLGDTNFLFLIYMHFKRKKYFTFSLQMWEFYLKTAQNQVSAHKILVFGISNYYFLAMHSTGCTNQGCVLWSCDQMPSSDWPKLHHDTLLTIIITRNIASQVTIWSKYKPVKLFQIFILCYQNMKFNISIKMP